MGLAPTIVLGIVIAAQWVVIFALLNRLLIQAKLRPIVPEAKSFTVEQEPPSPPAKKRIFSITVPS